MFHPRHLDGLAVFQHGCRESSVSRLAAALGTATKRGSVHKSRHLKDLEAESIHILREVAGQFNRPVLMYSIGKDSSVLLHLTLKAFHPAKPPFPLLHVDTTWKFQEMIQFRDN